MQAFSIRLKVRLTSTAKYVTVSTEKGGDTAFNSKVADTTPFHYSVLTRQYPDIDVIPITAQC